MTIQINTRTFVGISQLLLQRRSDGVIFSWPQPETFVLNTNIEEVIQTGRNTQGRRVRVNSYVSGEMPDLVIQYQYLNPEMVAFQVGKQLAVGTFDTFVPRSLAVTKTVYDAASSGYLYNGILASEAAKTNVLEGAMASYTDNNGVSVALTKVADFDNFNFSSTKSFAVGTDGALKFSNDLVAEQAVVTMIIPSRVAGAKLSETLIGPMRMYALLVDTNNKVSIFEAPSVTANLSGRGIDFNGGAAELAIYINNLPGSCTSWNLYSLDAQVACA